MKNETLFQRVKEIHNKIPADVMGGSPLDKCYMMAYLAERLKLKTFVEIGVYRGKSLFSVAPAFINNGGRCYGIDPWIGESMKEKELPNDIKKLVDDFADNCDFDALYNEVLELSQNLGMDTSITLLRKTSKDAYDYFNQHIMPRGVEVAPISKDNKLFIDMLHIDGNHDYEHVIKDVQLYMPHVRTGGIIVFDDIEWQGVRRAFDSVKLQYVVLYQDSNFAVLYKDSRLAMEMRDVKYSLPSWSEIRLLQMSLPALMQNVCFSQNYEKNMRPLTIFAAIMTYNSSAYIEECVRSIVAQQGNFEIMIGVFDDASTDDTIERILRIRDLPANVSINVYPKVINEGYEKNYIRVFDVYKKSNADFITCIDGDDYLLSPLRFMRNVNELLYRPECALSFNRLLYYNQINTAYELWNYQDGLIKNTYTASELAEEYFIGNGSCSTVRRNAAIDLSKDLFLTAKIGDWLTHCMYATKGDIAYIREPMNVYRKHDQGVWSMITTKRKNELLLPSIAIFNSITNYLFYDKLYQKQAVIYQNEGMEDTSYYDLTIVDDVFPHPTSGFRYEEFSAYLSHFKNMRILCNGGSTSVLGKRTHFDILAEYKQAHPEFSHMVIESKHPYELQMNRKLRSKLAYFCFLGNVYTFLDVLERDQIPFVFELYPGGSFQLDAEKSDSMLERVFKSPCFRKVIVTQDVTRDYLLSNDLCAIEQIVSIFGVVTPRFVLQTVPCINVGGDESTLKVCFAAFRYTPTGRDKGYDVFVDAARHLVGRYKNIEFHVAGNFDETIVSLDGLEGRVTFHGVLANSSLSDFLKEMDIIVSPNLNNCIEIGAFDGFPTATCTEAGLNGVLIICTDPLRLNNNRFKNGDEIEIVDYDAYAISEKIEYYYKHRDALRDIIRKQGKRIREIYASDIQIGGRIQVLEQEIGSYSQNLQEIRTRKSMVAKRLSARMFYSSVPNEFFQDHVIDFELQVSQNGNFEGKIPLHRLNSDDHYIWIYFLNETSSCMKFELGSYCQHALQILDHNAVTVANELYYFIDTAPMIYLGLVEGLNKDKKYLSISGHIQSDLKHLLESEGCLKKLCTGAILHADNSLNVGASSPIPFHYFLEQDGRFSFTINLQGYPKEHTHLWLYFIANHSCECVFNDININGNNLKVSELNGEIFEGVYLFNTLEPFLYFNGFTVSADDLVLSASGVINITNH